FVEGRGRQVRDDTDLADYDIVLAMDRSNLSDLRRMAPALSERMHLYRAFDPAAESDEMPDPYGLTDSDFDATVRRVRSGAKGIVAAIVSGRLP
ncbi:MAG: low molecular weight phosphotyrosine protein phosphatase, partial [Acidimicrobiia bacterium]